jgi:hypothetical protein
MREVAEQDTAAEHERSEWMSLSREKRLALLRERMRNRTIR